MKNLLICAVLFSLVFPIDPETEADYLIITHSSLVGASQWLSDLVDIQSSRGYQVGTIEIADNDSAQDISDYISSAYTTGVPVRFVLLAGAASAQTTSSGSMEGGKFGLNWGQRDVSVACAADFNFIPFTIEEDQQGWNEIIDIPTDDLYYPSHDLNTGVFIGRIPTDQKYYPCL